MPCLYALFICHIYIEFSPADIACCSAFFHGNGEEWLACDEGYDVNFLLISYSIILSRIEGRGASTTVAGDRLVTGRGAAGRHGEHRRPQVRPRRRTSRRSCASGPAQQRMVTAEPACAACRRSRIPYRDRLLVTLKHAVFHACPVADLHGGLRFLLDGHGRAVVLAQGDAVHDVGRRAARGRA